MKYLAIICLLSGCNYKIQINDLVVLKNECAELTDALKALGPVKNIGDSLSTYYIIQKTKECKERGFME